MHGIEEFGPGRRYDINKEEEIEIEIVGELVEIDMEVRGDKRMSEIVREVGPPPWGTAWAQGGMIRIRLTADYPSNHLGARVPILDIISSHQFF